ncbi:hypothetical protein CY35_03G100600 [Sphagnum magellanicum]|nr:hypothetical protein CY35_03G100600 [Sphagnum magellanicum]
MGVIERDRGTLYCSVLSFGSGGKFLGKHCKLMPTASERLVWGFGDGSTLPVFDTPIGRVGTSNSGDLVLANIKKWEFCAGIEFYCAPTADARVTWQASMIHIALEGGCFVLSANQFCRWQDYPPAPEYVIGGMGEGEPSPEDVVCAGGSVIISPSGTILAGPNFEDEGLITADLDPADIVRAKFDLATLHGLMYYT